MIFENFENILSLLCTIVGLLYGVFKYIESPKRGYRLVVIFFLANFLSEYYWTVYELLMRDYPEVSEFVAYLGWNISFFVLALAVFFLRPKETRKFMHPLIFLPVLFSVPQFILYIQYGGIVNNIWQVGVTTVAMVFCLQHIIWAVKEKKGKDAFPWFSVIALVYLLCEYGMWTSSCFDWPSDWANPYLYFSILGSVCFVFFTYGAVRHYRSEENDGPSKGLAELRLQVLIQTVISLLIVGICAAGFILSLGIRDSLIQEGEGVQNTGLLVIYLFIISAILILAVFAILFFLTSRYRRFIKSRKILNETRSGRINFILTVIVTLSLLVFAVAYHNTTLWNAEVVSVHEDGDKEIKSVSTELENYLTLASTTLRVMADSTDLMLKSGRTTEEIGDFLVQQTTVQKTQFDENFTGLYALINGVYLDGLEWVPPADYNPLERDWYKLVSDARGEVVIVSPYLDAQTGSIVITIGKMISSPADETQPRNVVCLDVIVNHIQEVTENVQIGGKGYGVVLNRDGFIIAHADKTLNGQSVQDVHDQELLDDVLDAQSVRISETIDGEDYTLFIAPVMDQWTAVLVISNAELFDETYTQLAISIIVSLITFCLITFFYYIGYKNERQYGQRLEAMNIQVVSALATAIDAKDSYTNGHSTRVATYAKMIASRAGYSKDDQDEIYMMGLLHDVGKIGVPDEVINKPDKLTPEEFELIKKHPVIGSEILNTIKDRPKLATGARWHHERYDGKGYPDGIAGKEIPEEARIIAVADAYDAMTSRRRYREILPQDKVREEIVNGTGTQFDPGFAKIMLSMIDEDKDYSMREHFEESAN